MEIFLIVLFFVALCIGILCFVIPLFFFFHARILEGTYLKYQQKYKKHSDAELIRRLQTLHNFHKINFFQKIEKAAIVCVLDARLYETSDVRLKEMNGALKGLQNSFWGGVNDFRKSVEVSPNTVNVHSHWNRVSNRLLDLKKEISEWEEDLRTTQDLIRPIRPDSTEDTFVVDMTDFAPHAISDLKL